MSDALARSLEPFEAQARRLEGWQLDYEPEPLVAGPPWSYEEVAGELCSRASDVLDLGTGGGEVYSRLLSRSSARAFATEEWHVNAPVASMRLHGRAHVARASSLALPFGAATFGLVLSRHEEILPSEIARLVRPGGRFLTQQLGSDLWHELGEVFAGMTRFPDHREIYPRELEQAGLEIEALRDFHHGVRFRELGHLVYHLVAAPWTIPGFSVATHLEGLAELERRVRSADGLVLTESFYLLQARARD